MLSPQQVTSILSVNELSKDVRQGVVKSFDTNQLKSNSPIEDRRANAQFLNDSKFLFSVIDGHAGCACAQTVSERLFYYITVAMSSAETLEKVVTKLKNNSLLSSAFNHLQWHRHDNDYVSHEYDDIYKANLIQLANEVVASSSNPLLTEQNLYNSFMRLDEDISSQALPNGDKLDPEMLQIAFSGACVNVAYIDGMDLYVANTGDCRAVLGVNSGDGIWEAVNLSVDHNADNETELERLYDSHPNESANVIKNGRLLGDLAPLRAFGDVRYKWSQSSLKQVQRAMSSIGSFHAYGNDRLVPSNYISPPYLTAKPEVLHHTLTHRDKFLVMASDGLWDMMHPDKVVKLVAGHLHGKQVLVDFALPEEKLSLGDINKMLMKRKAGLSNRTIDSHASTHLIRNALGHDHAKVSTLLTLPDDLVRFYRDDITVTVIYFDTDYIRSHKSFEESSVTFRQ